MSPRRSWYPEEASGHLREMEIKLARLTDQLFYAKRSHSSALTRARKAEDESRFLHGVLLLHGIEPPERGRK